MANYFSKNESCPDSHLIIMIWFLISVLQFLCDQYTVHSGHYFVKLSLTNETKFGAKLNILLKNTKTMYASYRDIVLQIYRSEIY